MIDKIKNNKLDHSSENTDLEETIDNFLNTDDLDDYLDHLKLDGSKDSYLQFVILAELGSQFSLFWHAFYHDQQFACTLKAAEKIVDQIDADDDNFGFLIDGSFKENLQDIDFKPEVEIKEDEVVVRMVYFTKWGGFIEGKYRVIKEFPHQILEIETKELRYYDCGYMY